MKGLTTYRFTDFVEHNDSMFTLGINNKHISAPMYNECRCRNMLIIGT